LSSFSPSSLLELHSAQMASTLFAFSRIFFDERFVLWITVPFPPFPLAPAFPRNNEISLLSTRRYYTIPRPSPPHFFQSLSKTSPSFAKRTFVPRLFYRQRIPRFKHVPPSFPILTSQGVTSFLPPFDLSDLVPGKGLLLFFNSFLAKLLVALLPVPCNFFAAFQLLFYVGLSFFFVAF